MYTKANKWEIAHSLATSFMTPEAVNELYISQAREMEMKGIFLIFYINNNNHNMLIIN